MATVTLRVEAREVGGKGSARALRRAEQVPGIFYGPTIPPVPLAVQTREMAAKLGTAQGSQLVRLASQVAEVDGKIALVKEVQRHPLTAGMLHIDFYAVDPNRRLKLRAPLSFVGKPAGVTAGGILQTLRREVTVECLPSDIPGAVEVDVSELAIHDTIHVEDLTLPEGVRVIAETNYALVTVVPPTVEEVEAAPEAAPEGEAAPAEAAATPAQDEGKKSPEE